VIESILLERISNIRWVSGHLVFNGGTTYIVSPSGLSSAPRRTASRYT